MRIRTFSTIALASLTLAACGGGDSGQQGEVADMVIEFASDAGFEVDDACVREVTKELSDDDAAKIVAAGMDGDPELSEAGDAVGDKLFEECVSIGG